MARKKSAEKAQAKGEPIVGADDKIERTIDFGDAESSKAAAAREADWNEDLGPNVKPEAYTEDAQAAQAGQAGGNAEGSASEAGAGGETVDSEKYMRLMAEFQNYKRRTEKEKSDLFKYASEKLVVQLVEILDNFDRALNQSGAGGEAFAEGMQLIFKQLTDVLEKNGVEEIKALGEDFDPNFHNAVMMEDTDKYESGKVSDVLQKGYILNGKVVRPSMVKVAN
ncbi:MAG: nucleotide exchange factor GrpE [Firmicutes bacterium]|nr:nucleotide exchange factor GrpE [Bacillota bacterium]